MLAPGGVLALVWRWPERPRYRARWPIGCASCATTTPGSWATRAAKGWSATADSPSGPTRTVPFTHASDQEGQLAMLASASFVANLPEAERRELLELAAGQLPAGPIEVAYRAEVWRARRL